MGRTQEEEEEEEEEAATAAGGKSISGGFIPYSPHCWKSVNSSSCAQVDGSVLAISGNHTEQRWGGGWGGGNAPSLTLSFSLSPLLKKKKKKASPSQEKKNEGKREEGKKKKKIREADTLHPLSSL